jgi:hypothetical protein
MGEGRGGGDRPSGSSHQHLVLACRRCSHRHQAPAEARPVHWFERRAPAQACICARAREAKRDQAQPIGILRFWVGKTGAGGMRQGNFSDCHGQDSDGCSFGKGACHRSPYVPVKAGVQIALFFAFVAFVAPALGVSAEAVFLARLFSRHGSPQHRTVPKSGLSRLSGTFAAARRAQSSARSGPISRLRWLTS